jgi:lysophospholipase L1-like esterase
MSLADVLTTNILNLSKQNIYNVANMVKKPVYAHLTPVAFRDMNIAGQNNANPTGTTRFTILPKFTCQDIVIAYSNYYNGGTGTPTPTTNPISVKASLELNGTLIPIYFNGNRTINLAPGSVVYSDPIPCIMNPTDSVFVRTYYKAGLPEVDTLNILSSATAAGNVTVTLNGTATNIAVLAGDTNSVIASKIASTTFTGWTTSVNNNIVTFTNNTVQTCSSPSFSAGTTGVIGNVVQTIVGTTNNVPYNSWLYDSDGMSDGFSSGVDLTDSGTVSNTYMQGYTCTSILGATSTKRDSYLLLGDSIISGTGDSPWAAHGATGFVSRALTNSGLGWNKISMGGELVAGALTSLYIRRPYFNDHNKVIVNYATNDISPTANLSTIKTNLLKMWLYLHNLGLTVYQTTISPKTTSTDNWTTLTNQTVLGSGQETLRQGINSWLRDSSSNGAIAQSNGTLYKIMDTAQAVEDIATGKWKVYNSGNPIFTGNVTSSTSSSITCSTLPYASRSLDNTTVVKITGGTGSGQMAQVNNNYSPSTQITINGSFSTVPDATSTFALYTVATYDGTHPCVQAHIDMSAYVNV